MQHTFEHDGRFFPADAQAPVVLQPTDGAFNDPTSFVSSQRAAVLCFAVGLAIAAMGSDQFNPIRSQSLIERIAVIRLVTDDPFGPSIGEHEVEQLLHELAFMWVGRTGIDRDGQALRVDQHHDFHAFSCLRAADAIAAASGFGERAIDETLVEFVAVAFLNARAGVAHERFEDIVLDPTFEPSMHGALAAESSWQVLPFGTVVENPEDALDDLAFVGRWPATARVAWRVGNPFTNPVKLFVHEYQHESIYARPTGKVLG